MREALQSAPKLGPLQVFALVTRDCTTVVDRTHTSFCLRSSVLAPALSSRWKALRKVERFASAGERTIAPLA